MISTEQAFNELGTDALTGVEMMDWLGLSPIDLGNPQRFHRLQEVIAYFKQFPSDTQRFLIVRATNGKMVDKLNHVWEYARLLEQRKGYEDIIASVEKERSILGESPDPLLQSSVDSRFLEAKGNLGKINDEIAIYEK